MIPVKNICISRLDKMGDMILSLPAIKAIKDSNPEIKINMLASHQNIKVLKDLKYIDNIIEINTRSTYRSLIKNFFIIRKIDCDLYLNLSPSFLSYFFCFFSNSKNKGTLIFLTRYRKSIFSKLFTRILSKIFCNYVYTIDRFTKLKNREELHQTEMVFRLINICNIPYNKNVEFKLPIPLKKFNIIPLNKNLITIHLSVKWINKYYTEKRILNLLFRLPKKNNLYVLTTDNSTSKKFTKIYENFNIISNEDFVFLEKLNKEITILDRLNFENWSQVISSSKQIITPECGCSHISSAFKIPVAIIYDAENLPEAIYKEYHPWKSAHQKLIFGDKKLDDNIIEFLK